MREPQVHHLLKKLPPYQGNETLVMRNQDTYDIIREIMQQHRDHAGHYDRIAIDHWQGDPRSTAEHLYRFLKHNAPYRAEKSKQTTKTPAGILQEARIYGNDCKHYASYVIGVGEALSRKGYPVKCFYRFASYDTKSRSPRHVFGVWVINGKEYWIDPVPEIHAFNSRNITPAYTVDKLPPMSRNNTIGSLYRVSGIGAAGDYAESRPMQSTHWLDNMPVSGIGKAKKKKGPGIIKKAAQAVKKGVQNTGKKVQKTVKKAGQDIKKGVQNTGKKIKKGVPLVKKYTLATSRGAFLTMVKLNAAGLAVKFWLNAAKDKNSPGWKKLSAQWIKLGGKPDALYNNIKQGVNTYNKLHKNNKVTGINEYMDGMEDEVLTITGICNLVHNRDMHRDRMGVAPAVASAGIVAAAAPILTALAALIKSFGINHKKLKSAGEKDAQDLAEKHNSSMEVDEEGNVIHADGTESEVTDNADGSQTLTVKHLPGATDGEYNTGDGDVEEAEEVDDEGNVITKTKTITKTKKKSGSGGSFSDMMANVTEFVTEHKTAFILGGVGVAALFIVPPIVRNMNKPKRRR